MCEKVFGPFPITREAIEDMKNSLKNGILKEKFDRIEELKHEIVKEYEEHAEKVLKDVPPLARYYCSKVHLHVQGNSFVLTTDHPVAALPEYVSSIDLNTGIIALHFEPFLPSLKEFSRLSTETSFVNDIECRKQYNSETKTTTWYIGGVREPFYNDILNELTEKYIKNIKDEISELVTGKKPVFEKPAIQLDLFGL